MKKLQSLTKKELLEEVEQRVHNARQEFYEFGLETGFKDCIIRVLDSGTHPQFISKITNVELKRILELADAKKESD